MRCWIAIVVLGGLALAAPQKNGQADILFERAVQKETADGDLKAALELYKQAVAKAGANRTVAAMALIRMGQCYEKLGHADARKAYERVIREFGDQKDAAAEARRRLGTKGGQPAGVVARRIETPAEVWPESVRGVSHDGRFLVCAAGNQATRGIYLRNVETGETRTILGESPRMRNPLRLSPDGSQIAFILGRDRSRGDAAPELHVARTDGAGLRAFTAKDLGGKPSMPSLWGWTPDGQSVLLNVYSEPRKDRLILVRVSDGVVRDLGSAAMSGSVGQAKLSPDGRFIAYTKAGGPGYMGKGIAVRSLDGSRDVSLSPDGINPLWAPDGKRVLFTSNRRGPTDLWAIPVADGEPAGPAEMVRESVSWPLGITRDGELFHKTAFEMRDLYTVAFDPQSGRRTSKPTKITHRYANAGPAWSPDGRFLAYTSIRDGLEPGAGDPASLVIRTMATGEDREVVPKIGLDMNLSNPQWFPDGRSLLIQPQWGRQSGKLAKVDVETGDVEMLPGADSLKTSGNWYNPGATLSPDGKTLYYPSPGSQPGQDRIVRRTLPNGPEMELGSVTSTRSPHISVSPDGRTLAFWVRPGENANAGILMTMPATGGEPRPVKMGEAVPSAGFTAWSRDGKRIFFVGVTKPGGDSWRNQESDIWSVPAEGGEPVPLRIGLHTIWFFHLHPDGRQLVFYDEYYPPSEVWSVRNLPGIGKAAR